MRAHILLAAASAALVGCDESTGPARATMLEVVVSTTGPDRDRDGYALRIDGGAERRLQPCCGADFRVESGRHALELTGVAPNCRVTGGTHRSVVVEPGGSARVEFAVTCGTTWGVVLIEVSTTGYFGRAIDHYRAQLSPDPGFGHSVLTTQVAPNGVHYLGRAAGVVYVRLLPSPDICGVLGPTQVTIPTGGLVRDTARVRFNNWCDG